MTETDVECAERLVRLLKEELKPREIPFVILVGLMPPGETERTISLYSTVDAATALSVLANVLSHYSDEELNALSHPLGGKPAGHA